MAAKGKRAAPSIRAASKSRSTGSKRAAADKVELMRHARTGRRTTLRVPRALEAEVTRTAKELEVSENEALIRLAQMGALTAKRQRDLRRVIGKRRAAVSGAASATEHRALPSSEEMQAAILTARD